MDKYIQQAFTLTVAGACGEGKSYMIEYLIECFQNSASKFDAIFVFSSTANFSNDYKFLEKQKEKEVRCAIFSALELDARVAQIMKIQANNRKRNVKRQVLIVFDDIMGAFKDSKQFSNLVSTYRHYNISVIFSIQYISKTAAYLREISKYVVIFKQKGMASKKLAFDNYFSAAFETFKHFQVYIDTLQQYQFIFIDRSNDTMVVMKCP